MGTIRNMKLDESGIFEEGFFDSKSLFEGEMQVNIFVDDGADVFDLNP